jgi:phage gp46-like protein
MADITTIWNAATQSGDWAIAGATPAAIWDETSSLDLITDIGGGVILDEPLFENFIPGLVSGEDLVTAVALSLLTDQLAGPDDVIPDGSSDPRGWWGDLGAAYPIGSKIWLRLRSKQTSETLALVKDDIQQALAWLIADGVAASVDATTSWVRAGFLGASVLITQPSGGSLKMTFAWAWKGLS